MIATLIDYDHASNAHGLEGPKTALPILVEGRNIRSLLDVGCGTGTWLKAALDLGIPKVRGVDGVFVKDEELLVPRTLVQHFNFELPFNIGETFDAVLCLEVAEHLSPSVAAEFIRSLCRHSDLVFFSAACPGQPGQHHINCQWPDYWQNLFNENGFACSDSARWLIWDKKEIEFWYRQNLFCAVRNIESVGREPRIMPVIHPDHVHSIATIARNSALYPVMEGSPPLSFYARLLVKSAFLKVGRKWRAKSNSFE